MALAAMLIVLESVRARLRPTVVAWLLTVTLALDPLPSGFQTNSTIWVIYARVDVPKIIVGLIALYVVASFARRRYRWSWLVWTVSAAMAFVHYPVIDVLAHYAWPTWLCQVLLVSSGLVPVAVTGWEPLSGRAIGTKVPTPLDASVATLGSDADLIPQFP